MSFLFQGCIFRFHVNLQGCTYCILLVCQSGPSPSSQSDVSSSRRQSDWPRFGWEISNQRIFWKPNFFAMKKRGPGKLFRVDVRGWHPNPGWHPTPIYIGIDFHKPFFSGSLWSNQDSMESSLARFFLFRGSIFHDEFRHQRDFSLKFPRVFHRTLGSPSNHSSGECLSQHETPLAGKDPKRPLGIFFGIFLDRSHVPLIYFWYILWYLYQSKSWASLYLCRSRNNFGCCTWRFRSKQSFHKHIFFRFQVKVIWVRGQNTLHTNLGVSVNGGTPKTPQNDHF